MSIFSQFKNPTMESKGYRHDILCDQDLEELNCKAFALLNTEAVGLPADRVDHCWWVTADCNGSEELMQFFHTALKYAAFGQEQYCEAAELSYKLCTVELNGKTLRFVWSYCNHVGGADCFHYLVTDINEFLGL